MAGVPNTARPDVDALVLDTTALFADLPMEGVQFRTLFHSLVRLDLELVVPQLVLDEAARHFARKRDAAIAKVREGHRDLRRVVGMHEASAATLDESRWQYRFSESKNWPPPVTVLGYPSVDHQTVARRELADRKPFNGEGKGYRDALIWLSTVEYLRGNTKRVVLVTANTKDFTRDGELHPDLLADLTAASIDPARLVVCARLDEFNERYVVPFLEPMEKMRLDLEQGRLPGLDLKNWLSERILGALSPSVLAGVAYPEDEGHVTTSHLRELDQLRVTDVHALDEGVFRISFVVRAVLYLMVERPDAFREFLSPPRVAGGPSTLRKSVKVAREYLNATIFVEGECIWVAADQAVDSLEIVQIEGAEGGVEIYADRGADD